MPEMIKSKGLRALIEKGLGKLPLPAAMFIINRILTPLVLMVVASIFAVAFAIFMLIVVVIAPFSPKSASHIFHYIVDGMGE
ncbi:MAG: hypothetical protein ACRCUF_08895 [Aeromonas sobria]